MKEQFRTYLYEHRNKIERVLNYLILIVSIIAIATTIYYHGFIHEPGVKQYLINSNRAFFLVYVLNYVFKELSGFNQEQDIKIREVLKRVKLVINSEEFKQRVLNHEFQGTKTFVDNAGLTNEEIYQKIMDGEEMLIPGVNHTMDLSLTMYYTNNSTVGYTYADTTMVWMNSKFFNSYTYGEAGGNVVHEWTHKLGFEHSYYNDYARPYSVPYAIGTIIEDLIDTM